MSLFARPAAMSRPTATVVPKSNSHSSDVVETMSAHMPKVSSPGCRRRNAAVTRPQSALTMAPMQLVTTLHAQGSRQADLLPTILDVADAHYFRCHGGCLTFKVAEPKRFLCWKIKEQRDRAHQKGRFDRAGIFPRMGTHRTGWQTVGRHTRASLHFCSATAPGVLVWLGASRRPGRHGRDHRRLGK